MSVSTVNISFKDELLAEIDSVARRESRSRSELIREATRAYIERKKRWQAIFDLGAEQAKKLGLSEEDISNEIENQRAGKTRN